MTSITPRIITIALLVLAVAAPVASARPLRDAEGVQTSSLAGTTSPPMREDTGTDSSTRAGVPDAPPQDLRNADQRGPGIQAYQDLRNPDQRVVPATPDAAPAPAVDKPAPVAADDDPSPFVYIIPGVVLIAMLGAGLAYARTSRTTRATA